MGLKTKTIRSILNPDIFIEEGTKLREWVEKQSYTLSELVVLFDVVLTYYRNEAWKQVDILEKERKDAKL